MGLRSDVSKIAKLAREALLLEALQEFPDVTEEELISVLEGWKSWRDKDRGGNAGSCRDAPLAGEVAE